jgi:NAD(P)-dependent dehydrogenase (short-subunit alcohol dehydrogenase family)
LRETQRNLFSLEGKEVWVFGGAGYLGQSTVTLLRDAGADVLCADLGDRADSFVRANQFGASVVAASLDIGDPKATAHFVDQQVKQRGVPHGVVNLTFASTAKALEELTEKDFDDSNHVGLTATFLLAREVGMRMAQARRGGSIVLFSSMYGSVSPDPLIYEAPMNKNPIEYGVGKAGIIQMTRYLAVHWGRQNVRCNCISPGPFPNPGVQAANPGFVDRLAQKSPLGRIGQPEEIAGAVQFLLSDAASYITGQNLFLDGGWKIW